MRPVTLYVEGFGVFRAPVEISFDDVDYFALTGPTGAGKSTVIDAICFALYGSVPRYGDERLVGRAVSVGAQSTKVSLTFDIGPQRYRATRLVRIRNGRATTPEAVLERADGEVLAGSAREMKPAVERLLGLPFGHFTKCVVLPQGEFARFLHDDPAKRRDLLARLLDLQAFERVGQLARGEGRNAESEMRVYEAQLAELAFATDDARDAARTRVEQLRTLYDAVDRARAHDEALARDKQRAAEQVGSASALAALLAEVHVPDSVGSIARELDTARHAHERAVAERETASRAVEDADARLEALPDPTESTAARDAHAALGALRERVDAAVAAEAARTEALVRAEEVAAHADAHLEETQAVLAAARDAHAAHALAERLVPGEPCPVCAHVVEEVPEPKRRRPAAFGRADAATKEATRLAKDARRVVDAAGRDHAAAVATRAQLEEQQAAHRAVAEKHPDPDAVARTLAEIEDATSARTRARQREQAARSVEAGAAATRHEHDARAATLADELRDRRDTLVRAGLDAPVPGGELAADWAALSSWAVERRDRQLADVTTAQRQAETARAGREELLAALSVRAREGGIDAETTTLATLRDAVIDHGAHARRDLERIDDAIEAVGKLREQVTAASAQRDVAHLLGDLLRSDRFERWVLAEALELLVDAASRTLFALSSGHYSLRYSSDDEFVVVDHRNADETRSVRTLSGGETFQASLALALALSDQLASLTSIGGVKLESIFLDEGFGALDADTLDAVATTVEALGTEGRMIGLVTHVPGLAERVPVRFRVHDGTVTREDA